jgi:hypothetical protein
MKAPAERVSHTGTEARHPTARPASRRTPLQAGGGTHGSPVARAKQPRVARTACPPPHAGTDGRSDLARRIGELVDAMKVAHAIRVRKYRKTMSGCAWRVTYSDGRAINWIEAPRPVSPISLAIFLHEVGHHVIGFDTYRRRCEEELAAWDWAIQTMRAHGIEPDDRVLRRYDLSMRYAVEKAVRRGIKQLAPDLHAFLPKAA